MQNRLGALLCVLVAATIHLSLGVRSARACSPIAQPQGKPCITIDLYKPSDFFPLNLVDEIRVAQSSFDGYYTMSVETFELSTPLKIARKSGDGYVEVAFELVSESGLVPGVLRVRLMEPTPGDYIVTSVDDTCSKTPSPIGEGALIGSFSLTATAAAPTVLGTAAWEGQELATQAISSGGIGGNCEPVPPSGSMTVASNTIRVKLADEVLPWNGLLETSIEVDGELYSGFGRAGDLTKPELNVVIAYVCSSSDPEFSASQSNRLSEGEHTLKVIGRVGHSEPFESNEVTFDIDCSPSGACSAAPGPRSSGNGPAWWALGAALLLRRTRRALRPR